MFYKLRKITVMKTKEISSKDKADLIKKVSKLMLSKKEEKLLQKIQEKGFKDWNDYDIEFLNLLYDLHYHPVLSIGGMDIYPYDQEIQIKKELEEKRVNAIKGLAEEPFSLWFKDVRNYNKKYDS